MQTAYIEPDWSLPFRIVFSSRLTLHILAGFRPSVEREFFPDLTFNVLRIKRQTLSAALCKPNS